MPRPETVWPDQLGEGALSGSVVHHRRFDIEHRFDYPVWMALSKLPDSSLPILLRPKAARYLPLDELASMLGCDLSVPHRQVWLLTQPSLLGRSFNPVSFYFLSDAGQLRAIVAHITNTPWDEDHCYVLEQAGDDTWVFDKDFHVSPFMPMNLTYQWRFRITAGQIHINMQLIKGSERIFSAVLNLTPLPASRWLGCKVRLKYPLQNLTTLVRIYWQAAILKLKGAQFYAHPDKSPAAHSRAR